MANRKRRGRGEGGVYQRGDGLWVGSVSLGYDHRTGKRRRKTVYGDTKAQAQENLRTVHPPALPDRPDLTVGQWLDHWLAVIEPTVEPNTLRPYRRHCRLHIAPRLGRLKLANLRPAAVQGFYADLLRDATPTLVKAVGTTLTVALNHAVRSGEIATNTAATVRKPKVAKPRVEIFTPDEARSLVAASGSARLGPMFALMLDAGTGPGETFALDWPDFDPVAGTVTVAGSLEEIAGRLRKKGTKNPHRVRRVELTDATVAALGSHREAMSREGHDTAAGPLFCARLGGRLRNGNVRRRDWVPFLKANGLPVVTMYALRHTMATLLLLAGVNPKIVSERLGHATITLTMDTYSHVLPRMQKQAAKVLQKLLA